MPIVGSANLKKKVRSSNRPRASKFKTYFTQLYSDYLDGKILSIDPDKLPKYAGFNYDDNYFTDVRKHFI
jgi:hypothetical protein